MDLGYWVHVNTQISKGRTSESETFAENPLNKVNLKAPERRKERKERKREEIDSKIGMKIRCWGGK